MTDVRIPEPANAAITSPTTITGQWLTGEIRSGDLWHDNPLELAGGSAQLLCDQLIRLAATGYLDLPQDHAEVLWSKDTDTAVEVTGTLDLPRGTAEVSVSINIVIQAEAVLNLVLLGDTAVVRTGVTLSVVDHPLELAECAVKLTIEVILRIAVDAIIPLELLGGTGIRINPILMPELCEDIDLVQALCDQLDLVVLACEQMDMHKLHCVHQGEWTILNTFESGERVLLGDGDVIFSTPLRKSDHTVLELEPVGCDDR